ncbi:MAG TPA: cytochrome b/b6 domain-containing protein [Hyphomonadaceae bacterium]|nr:cytochrome b/b6 domain-containing protein [Hyphomonadaceae bacterium]
MTDIAADTATAPAPTSGQRYTAVAIGLHWAIAIGIIGMLAFGFILDNMNYGPGSPKTALVQLHKATGITILLLSVARIIWRLMNPPPAEPPMPKLQSLLATTVHIFLYILIIAMPLTGWIMASASTAHETRFFGTLEVSLPGFAGMPLDQRTGIEEAFHSVHGNLAWFMIAFLALHLAGALKHQFIDKDGLMARMAPGLFGRTAGPPDNGHGVFWAFGASVLVFAVVAGAQLVSSTAPITPAAIASASDAAPPAADPTTTVPPGMEPGRMAKNSPAPAWTVDAAQSSIKFTGAYMGRAFTGKFPKFDATIQFDPAKPEDARIRVVVPIAPIDAGDPYFTENVTQGDWLDAKNNPEAVFEVNQGVFKDSEQQYEATGILTLKGQKLPVRLPFKLEINGANAKMHGETTLQRLAAGIGKGTLAKKPAKGDDEWVDDDIKVIIDVVATRQ